MLRLASISLSGRRVLTIEADYDVAAVMAGEIDRCGGILIGGVRGVSAALALLNSGLSIDCAMIATSHEGDIAALEQLRLHQVEIVFVTGYDDWFDDEDDAFGSLEPMPIFA